MKDLKDISVEAEDQIMSEEYLFRVKELKERYKRSLEEALKNRNQENAEFGLDVSSLDWSGSLHRVISMTTGTKHYNFPTIQELISFKGEVGDTYYWVQPLDLPEGFEMAGLEPALNLKTMDIKLFNPDDKLCLKPAMHKNK